MHQLNYRACHVFARHNMRHSKTRNRFHDSPFLWPLAIQVLSNRLGFELKQLIRLFHCLTECFSAIGIVSVLVYGACIRPATNLLTGWGPFRP